MSNRRIAAIGCLVVIAIGSLLFVPHFSTRDNTPASHGDIYRSRRPGWIAEDGPPGLELANPKVASVLYCDGRNTSEVIHILQSHRQRIDLALHGTVTSGVIRAVPFNEGLKDLLVNNKDLSISPVDSDFKDYRSLDIERISLFGMHRVGDAGISHILENDSLQFIGIGGAKVNGSGFDGARALAGLKSIAITSNGIPIVDLAWLNECTKLERLELRDVVVSGETIQNLRSCTTVNTLWLINCELSENNLEFLPELKGLNHLNLSGIHVTDAFILNVVSQLNLESIVVDHVCQVSSAAKHIVYQRVPECHLTIGCDTHYRIRDVMVD